MRAHVFARPARRVPAGGATREVCAPRGRLPRAALRRITTVALAGVLVFAPHAVLATPAPGSADTALQQALNAYRSAQETESAADRPAAFARAERLFAAAASGGNAGAELWTNLGTAALQAEHLGTAILAYRRALALDPDHRQALQNLAHARTLLPPWVPRPESGGFLDSFLAWNNALSSHERRGAAALAFLVAAAMLGGALATGSGAMRLFTVFPLVVWVLLAGSETFAAPDRGGVLTAADTVARAADSRNAPARFAEPLPAGTEVTIAETRGEWARVVLADGRDAWVSAAAVERVDPAAARR